MKTEKNKEGKHITDKRENEAYERRYVCLKRQCEKLEQVIKVYICKKPGRSNIQRNYK